MSEMNFDEQFERALKAGEEANRTEARAVGVNFDREHRMIVVELRNGSPFSFPVAWISGLRDASDEDIADVTMTPSGEGLHWAQLGEDLSLPALISGHFGPEPFDDSVFVGLCAELESTWFAERDTSVVDRLALANPTYSGELYEFFGQLIDATLGEGNEGVAEAALAARAWLQAEGFEIARKIAEENNRTLTTTTTPPPVDPNRSVAEGKSARPEAGPVAKVLPFPSFIMQRTGISEKEAYQRMDIPDDLVFVLQLQGPGKQQKIRNEIAGRAEKIGIGRREALDSLEQQFARAARDRSEGPPPTFREQLASLDMSDGQRDYWLSLADEEEG